MYISISMKRDHELQERIHIKYQHVKPYLSERGRRTWAASESNDIGYGGDALVSAATGLARVTIANGRKEIENGDIETERIRRPGAGRPPIEKAQPGITAATLKLVDPVTRGDPESNLRWTCKSCAILAAELRQQGYKISPDTVAELLRANEYSLQSVSKTQEGASHPDRDEQFKHISEKSNDFLQRGEPVVSVDTKKKELVGNFKNQGREWQPKGQPERALTHDFPDQAVCKAIPYGVLDLAHNEALVNVGNDHDTSEFAVASLRAWWEEIGKNRYPEAHDLLITADAGGSNGYRSRVWKKELQGFADETGLRVHVCHFPPGTSKWNKIEHRLFCFITLNWRGKPLRTLETVIELIGNTRTRKGLEVKAKLDDRKYPIGVKVTDDEMKDLSLHRNGFHGDWNYEIHPNRS